MRQRAWIGQYAVHEAIATGGMASVHFGTFAGPAGFARTVAVKRMHRHLCDDPEFVAMFVDEARLAARVRHPNVVGTIDVLPAGGELLIVMEYVHGEPLGQLARRVAERQGRIPPAIACAVLCDVLSGLHAAHEATDDGGTSLGLVHRDVSPDNVLVGLDGLARVLDFGVAKAVGRLQVTREGQVKGKIAYMAPEQVRGGAVDRRTDVYAASVVLWELLTGRRLFEGAREGALVEKILFGAVDAPAAVAPHVPEPLNDVVLRGLARDPAERFATAREMERALRQAARRASASELGDWVAATAGDVLAARASILASVQRDGRGADGDWQPEADTTPSVPAKPVPAEPDRMAVVLHTDVHGSAPVAADQAPFDRRARLRRAATIGAVVVAIGGGTALLARPAHEPPRGPVETAAGAHAAPESAPAAPPPSAQAAPDPAAAPVPPASTARSTPAEAPAQRAPVGKRPASPSSSTAAPARGECDPPYTTDAEGTRIYKMRCL